jgi:hypothetical protein
MVWREPPESHFSYTKGTALGNQIPGRLAASYAHYKTPRERR